MTDGTDPSYSKAMDILNKYNNQENDKKDEETEDAKWVHKQLNSDESSASGDLQSTSDVAGEEVTPSPFPEAENYDEKGGERVAKNANIIVPKNEDSESEESSTMKKTSRDFSCERMAAFRVPVATGPTEPDPGSERDVNNASPGTNELCGQFECHYCIYLYSRPSDVDDDTLPFRRKACLDSLQNIEDEERKKKLDNNKNVLEAKRDKRLLSIEIRSGCKIRLSDLSGRDSLIKGLPRRRLTIAGPTFSHICLAIQMLELFFPRIMQFALYPYRLPIHCSTNITSEDKINHCYRDFVMRQPSCLSLRAELDDKAGWRTKMLTAQPKEA